MIPSPCNKVCRIDPGSGYCLGCARTLEEIGRWSLLSEAEQRTLVAELPARRIGPDDQAAGVICRREKNQVPARRSKTSS